MGRRAEIFARSDHRRRSSAQSFQEVVADSQSVGDGRQRRVDRSDAGEDARVDDIQVVLWVAALAAVTALALGVWGLTGWWNRYQRPEFVF